MIRLLVVALSIYVCAGQSCFDVTKEVECKNCDFSLQKQAAEDGLDQFGNDGYVANIVPDEWELGNSIFVALSGCRAWGGMETPGGVPYGGIYCPGKSVGRTFKDLTPKREYFLSFYAAERRGYGGLELLTVTVNGESVVTKLSPLDVFTKHTYAFIANEQGEAAVEFLNDSPASVGCSKKANTGLPVATVLFTLIKVYPGPDCGDGASCYNPLSPATKYTCRCDKGDTHGKAVVGAAAVCTDKDDLPEQIETVQAQVSAVERSFGGLSEDVQGLQQALKAATLDASEQADGVATLQDRMAAVEGKVDGIQQDFAALLSALKAGQVPKSALTVPAEAGGGGGGGGGGDAPEITADGDGSLNLQVQSGKRVTVNGDSLLTADDVTELIRGAVAAALQSVAGSA